MKSFEQIFHIHMLNAIMMIADVLAPYKHQTISNHNSDPSVTRDCDSGIMQYTFSIAGINSLRLSDAHIFPMKF